MGRRRRERQRQATQARKRWTALAVMAAVVAAIVLVQSCDSSADEPPRDVPQAAPVAPASVTDEYPHDPQAFTQGLLLDDGVLYESTGLYGESSVRRVDLETGQVLDSLRLGDAYFGEGMAALDGRLYVLTWREQRVFVLDQATLTPVDTLVLAGEGWGLTTDGDRFVWSDGSDRLRWLDPATLRVVREVQVRDAGRPVRQLNELEMIDGRIYANVWQTGLIAVVDPASGTVVQWIDASQLHDLHMGQGRDVLNGIAYDEAGDRLLVTGKLWPTLYAVVRPPTADDGPPGVPPTQR